MSFGPGGKRLFWTGLPIWCRPWSKNTLLLFSKQIRSLSHYFRPTPNISSVTRFIEKDNELKEFLERLNRKLISTQDKKFVRDKIAFLSGRAFKWTQQNSNLQHNQSCDLKRKKTNLPIPDTASHSSLFSSVSSISTADFQTSATPGPSMSLVENRRQGKGTKGKQAFKKWDMASKTFHSKETPVTATITTMCPSTPMVTRDGSLANSVGQTPAPRAPIFTSTQGAPHNLDTIPKTSTSYL